MTNKPPSTRAVNNRPKRRRREGLAAGAMPNETWLALVDDGKYDASWGAASVLLRNSVTKEQFVQEMAAARQPLGKVLSRVLKMARTMTSLPGTPYGE